MLSLKWVPNALSLSRILWGSAIFISACKDNWKWAFSYLLLGMASDWLDGYLAVKLNARSELGEKYLEDFGDAALWFGALAGLFAQGIWGWFLCLVVIAIFSIFGYATFFLSRSSRFHRICGGVGRFYYLLVLSGLSGTYAYKALGIFAPWLIIPAVPILAACAFLKRDRLKDWLNDIVS